MIWKCLPAQIDVPDCPTFTGIWNAGELYSFAYNSSTAVIVRAENLMPGFTVGDVPFARAPGLYNGRGAWRSGGTDWLFYSFVRGTWVYLPNAGNYPREPVYYSNNGTPSGDTWFEGALNTTNPRSAYSSTFTARGVDASTTADITIAAYWPRWERGRQTSEFIGSKIGGIYSPVGGESGTITIGRPTWRRSTDGVDFAKFINQRTQEVYYAKLDDPSEMMTEAEGQYFFPDEPTHYIAGQPIPYNSRNILSTDEEEQDEPVGTLDWVGYVSRETIDRLPEKEFCAEVAAWAW